MLRSLMAVALVVSAVSAPAFAQQSQPKTGGKVAVFTMRGPVTEKPAQEDFPFAMGETGESLKDLVDRMRKAGDDDKVSAVVMYVGNAQLGRAQIQEVRHAMAELRKKGKPIHVHLDTLMSVGGYDVACGASKISMVPTGYMFINGLYGESLYLRGLFEKIGITPDMHTCGDYKSAAEMYMRKGPSPEAEEMMNWIFDGLYANTLKSIAQGRNVKAKQVEAWIDKGVFMAENAKEAGLIDAVEHRQDFEASLRKEFGADLKLDFKYGKKKKPTIDFSSPMGILSFYAQLLSPPRRTVSTKDAVAVVYLEGPIMAGSSTPSLFGSSGGAYSTPIRRTLDKVAADDTIKAVVFRVDSPGGSAVASEIILDATRRVADKKPLIISMGNVAGSGGYYVTCAAKTIFADPSTITGSIGVVTGKIKTADMWGKLGITFKSYKRGKNAGLLSTEDTFSDSEKDAMLSYMHDVYDVFKQHVVDSRGDRLKKDIEELAGGRVYTGTQALDLGLVDQLGGLHDAVAFAAKDAKLQSYEVRVVPRPKNFLEQMMDDMSGKENDTNHLQLSTAESHYELLLEKVLPMLKGLQPRRLQAVMTALQQMSILQQDGISLTMPVLVTP